ncbi:hypothetical protein J3U01_08600 [Bifidobacterium sp. B4107]|uniref:hypothetical protein n=1 Tax=unclassified Bifidobacterium TaxID=2608897 RepID=UPI00226BBA15|nr:MULTISPECIES: hypothetical protein [unclassified Bifidobacterium]MCX8648458.1 hypothetical protein [Bifidobacterium sp. B4107]MCX8652550.1 hypothetical protein [Bifidobacterium sp. B4111]MCX8659086.1 hypothetical protein [Bifidobacterium sp. B4114]
MSWRVWVVDARDGRIVAPVDVPSFQWQMSIRDSSFSTAPQQPPQGEPGDRTASGLALPWSALPASTPAERSLLLDSTRRALCLSWAGSYEGDDFGTPVIWGVVGGRQDTQQDTSFPLSSPLELLSQRLVVRDGAFRYGRSPDVIGVDGLSYRGILCEAGLYATDRKQGGQLPFDWPYQGEQGTRQKTSWKAWNIQNNSAKKLLSDIADLKDGPDFTFIPYLTEDGGHVRVRLEAGSDGDRRLFADRAPVCLSYHPGAGLLDGLQVAHAAPVQRVYATGAGQDESVITALAEDLTGIAGGPDPQILRETAYSDTDTDNPAVLLSHAQAQLQAGRRKLIQLTAQAHFGDMTAGNVALSPASLRPGMPVILSVQGYPSLPDGEYRTSIMLLSGDQSDDVKITFDVMEDPYQ